MSPRASPSWPGCGRAGQASRRRLVEADLVECIVALPGQLFYGTGIPVNLWFLDRDKTPGGRGRGGTGRGEVLVVDAEVRTRRVVRHPARPRRPSTGAGRDAAAPPAWADELESAVLARLRDTLLPPLMSGQLRVRDVEQLADQGG